MVLSLKGDSHSTLGRVVHFLLIDNITFFDQDTSQACFRYRVSFRGLRFLYLQLFYKRFTIWKVKNTS